jgi:phosphatidylserine/phosphatidylglycerophosphate/cardiolipin synthase-like enzyme
MAAISGSFLALAAFVFGLSFLAPPVAAGGTLLNSDATPITSTVQAFLPLVSGPPPSRVLIAAAHIDSSVSGEADEAILLWNAGYSAQPLAGWRLLAGNRQVAFPITATLTLGRGERLWCAGAATAFRTSFGESPACEWREDSDPDVLNLEGSLQFANHGGFIQLLDADGQLVDALVYGDEPATRAGWTGLPAQLYDRGAIRKAGQVWQRKRDPANDQPVDNDVASDWAGDLADIDWGRRARYPGWRGWTRDDLAAPPQGEVQATVTVAVGPEGLYAPLSEAFAGAATSIDLSIYTLEHPELTDALQAALERGVTVRILLEGGPPGGIDDLQKWCVARLAAAGAEVRYMAVTENAPRGLKTRYSYAHAKYGLIDGRLALVGTDNLNWDSMPAPNDGPSGGRRGYYLLTDAEPVVAGLSRIFATDWRPDAFMDLHPFQADHPKFGGPPSDFVLPEAPVYDVTEAPFAQPPTVSGSARFMVVSAPENALRPDSGLLALIARAGPDDEIRGEQMYEHKFWGDSVSNPIADPNPRLEALIDAARRGARVRLLLDSLFDDPAALRSNRATLDYLEAIRVAEGIDLEARLGNPTGGGIHAKLFLLRIGDERWSVVGSLNGGEVSNKLNREVLILTDLAGVYDRLAAVFDYDWER